MKPWVKTKDNEVVFNGWRPVVKKFYRTNRATDIVFETTGSVGAKAVLVVALTMDNMAIVVEQFRVGPEKIMQDIPGGGVDGDENLIEAAKRELKEETGYEAGEIVKTGSGIEDVYSNVEKHYFLATNCVRTDEMMQDDTEDINLKLISIKELLANAKEGRMCDTLGVFHAYDKLNEMENNQ